jgi:hypothetical protein
MLDQYSLLSNFVFRSIEVLTKLLGRHNYFLSFDIYYILTKLFTGKVRQLEF